MIREVRLTNDEVATAVESKQDLLSASEDAPWRTPSCASRSI